VNSNENYKLSYRLYGLRVTFREEFVSSLWEFVKYSPLPQNEDDFKHEDDLKNEDDLNN